LKILNVHKCESHIMLYFAIAAVSFYFAWKYATEPVKDYRQEHPQFSKEEKSDSDDLLNPVAFQGHPPRPNPSEIKRNPYN
jgi:hypothetical protein